MEEKRNVVLVLGNGFDLALNRKTSYKDFWESEHCPKDYPAPLIKFLNEKCGSNCDSVRWYDFENQLLQYYLGTKNLEWNDIITKDEQLFLKKVDLSRISFGVYEGTEEVLLNSLIEKKIIIHKIPFWRIPNREDLLQPSTWRDNKAVSLIKEGLLNYIKSIQYKDEEKLPLLILNCMKRTVDNNCNLNVYSFNYTNIPNKYYDSLEPCFHHVHGDIANKNIIIGTQDYKDISTDYEFLQKSFDSKYAPPAIVYDLQTADDVIIYGHSLGINDQQYFKAFFTSQSSATNSKRKRITIFTKDERSVVEIKRSLQQMSDNNLATLYGMNELKIIATESLIKDQTELMTFLSQYMEKTDISRLFFDFHW